MKCKRLNAAVMIRRCASHNRSALGLAKSANVFVYWLTHCLVVLPSVVLTVGYGLNR